MEPIHSWRAERISTAAGNFSIGMAIALALAARYFAVKAGQLQGPTLDLAHLCTAAMGVFMLAAVFLLSRRRLVLEADVLRQVYPLPATVARREEVSAVQLSLVRGVRDQHKTSSRLPWVQLALRLRSGPSRVLVTSVDVVALELAAARLASTFAVPLRDLRGDGQASSAGSVPFYRKPLQKGERTGLALTDPRRPDVVPLPEGTLIRFGTADRRPQTSLTAVLLMYGSFALLALAALALTFGVLSGHLADVVGSPLFLGCAVAGVLMQRQAGRHQWVPPLWTVLVTSTTLTFTSPGGSSRTLPLDSIEEFRVSEDPDRDVAYLAIRSGEHTYTLDGFEPPVLHEVEDAVREALQGL